MCWRQRKETRESLPINLVLEKVLISAWCRSF